MIVTIIQIIDTRDQVILFEGRIKVVLDIETVGVNLV